MLAPVISKFGLSAPGSDHGVSCDASGIYIDSIPLLEKSYSEGRLNWRPRDSEILSVEITDHFGLPIDFSSRATGLRAIAGALNDGNVVKAQLVALFLRVPTPPQFSGSQLSRDAAVNFVRELSINGLIKIWDPDEHPRWPEGSPDSQGGQFAPKDAGVQVADAGSSRAVCREAAVVGCAAGVTSSAPEGVAAGCAVTGPGCLVGGSVGGVVTAIGSCIAGGIAGYEACHSITQSKPGRPINPDRPTDRAIKDQCIAQCSHLLERPERNGKWGTNEWDFRHCLEECIKEKNAYWGN